MNKFFSWVNEAVKLKHLEHIEDLIIIDGKEGVKTAIAFFKEVLTGLRSGDSVTQAKFDGAPAIIAGVNPENGKFFVATKSLFNKTPKINYTQEDINQNHEGGLAETLKIALEYFPELKMKGVFQGDIMYTRNSIENKTIDSVNYITFRPNTITYAIPVESELAKTILSSKIGVAWHTTYTGNTIEELDANFKIDTSKFSKTKNVYSTDTNMSYAQNILSDDEFEKMFKELEELEKEGTSFSDLSALQDNKDFILTYINSEIRNGNVLPNNVIKGLIDYITSKYEKDIEKLKTDASKNKKKEELDYIIQNIRKGANVIFYALKFHQKIQNYKTFIISILNRIKKYDTFVQDSDGYRVTTPEGYVAIGKVGGAVKLVDRLEFSKNNFNIVKNWS